MSPQVAIGVPHKCGHIPIGSHVYRSSGYSRPYNDSRIMGARLWGGWGGVLVFGLGGGGGGSGGGGSVTYILLLLCCYLSLTNEP